MPAWCAVGESSIAGVFDTSTAPRLSYACCCCCWLPPLRPWWLWWWWLNPRDDPDASIINALIDGVRDVLTLPWLLRLLLLLPLAPLCWPLAGPPPPKPPSPPEFPRERGIAALGVVCANTTGAPTPPTPRDAEAFNSDARPRCRRGLSDDDSGPKPANAPRDAGALVFSLNWGFRLLAAARAAAARAAARDVPLLLLLLLLPLLLLLLLLLFLFRLFVTVG